MGLDIHRFNPHSSADAQLLAAMDHANIDLIFDVGANTGQFALGIRTAGFRGDVVSFEPLSSARTELTEHSKRDRKWIAHDQCAIGDHDGEIEINIAGNSVSSSVLPMLESHSSAAAGSAYVGSERVPIMRLDSIADRYLNPNSRLFVKIDTQGYEWQVLDGGSKTLNRAKGVLCEISLVPLYEGQKVWLDVIGRLEAEGFLLWALQKGFIDHRTGRSLQMDAIFLRR